MLRKVIVLIPLAIILPRFIGVVGVIKAEPIADFISASTSGVMLTLDQKYGKESTISNSENKPSIVI